MTKIEIKEETNEKEYGWNDWLSDEDKFHQLIVTIANASFNERTLELIKVCNFKMAQIAVAALGEICAEGELVIGGKSYKMETTVKVKAI